MKKFELCTLCLAKVVKPVACLQGHLFCKQCLIENLIEQKKEKKREIKGCEESLTNQKIGKMAEAEAEKNKIAQSFVENSHSVILSKQQDKYERTNDIFWKIILTKDS